MEEQIKIEKQIKCICPSEVSQNAMLKSVGVTAFNVEIESGDWKHEHLACNQLMAEIGYTFVCDTEVEDSEEDCYSATKLYVKNEDLHTFRSMQKLFQ